MMPDFENVQRSLALKMARSAEERAYLMGTSPVWISLVNRPW